MYENEIDYVMGKSKISFGPDTAHLLASGCDPVEMFKRYAGRIGFVHLKDMRQGKALRVNEKPKEAFEIYVDFLELGEGSIDFPEVFDILDKASYDGFLTVELDESRTTQKDSAFRSMAYLKKNLLPGYE